MITNKHSFEETKRSETERDDLWIQECLFIFSSYELPSHFIRTLLKYWILNGVLFLITTKKMPSDWKGLDEVFEQINILDTNFDYKTKRTWHLQCVYIKQRWRNWCRRHLSFSKSHWNDDFYFRQIFFPDKITDIEKKIKCMRICIELVSLMCAQ